MDPNIGRLLRLVAQDAASLTDRALRRILEVVLGYEHTGTVPRDDLWWSVRRNIEALMLCLAEDRTLSPGELEARRALGRRRARQTMPIDDVLRAFRVGYVELWEFLVEAAHDLGPDVGLALLQRASMVWTVLDEISTAVAEGHREVSVERDVDEQRFRLRFIAGLRTYPQGARESEARAQRLGLDPDASFVVAAFDPPAPDAGPAPLVVFDDPVQPLAILPTKGEHLADEQRLLDLLLAHGAIHVGLGTVQPSLGGAATSMEQAELAAHAARHLDRPAVKYRTGWLLTAVLERADKLRSILDTPLRLIRDDPDTEATLRTFLECHGSLAAAGRRLHLHPNTVAYRLRRFADASGMDPRTSLGAARSLALMWLLEAGAIPELDSVEVP